MYMVGWDKYLFLKIFTNSNRKFKIKINIIYINIGYDNYFECNPFKGEYKMYLKIAISFNILHLIEQIYLK